VTIKYNEPAPAQDTASVLLGMEGVTVTAAEEGEGGRLLAWARVSRPAACPRCGTVSESVHDRVVTCPRDVRHGSRKVDLFLEKRRLACGNGDCPQGTFTEWAPQVPPRCRITRRLLEHCGEEVAERGITPAGSARHNGVSWPSAHGAFTEKAGAILGDEPEPVAHLGIDEHRRGRARWRRDEETGEYVLLADRWHTCFYDLSGSQGLLGQVEGRTADDTAYWLAGAPPAWRDAVRVVAIGMCTICQSAVRKVLPGAKIAVDLFHVVQLAVKTAGDARRRAIRELYGRRGRSGDPEYGIKHLLEKNLENLSPEQFEKIIETLDATAEGAAGRPGLDRQGETPRCPEPARPRHRLRSLRAAGPRQALRLLRLVRAERAGHRADHPRPHDLPLGRRDRHRHPHRGDQRPLRKPQPHRQARSPPRLRLPQPRQPATPRPHRLHPRNQEKRLVTRTSHKTNGNHATALPG
jgi:transposase